MLLGLFSLPNSCGCYCCGEQKSNAPVCGAHTFTCPWCPQDVAEVCCGVCTCAHWDSYFFKLCCSYTLGLLCSLRVGHCSAHTHVQKGSHAWLLSLGILSCKACQWLHIFVGMFPHSQLCTGDCRGFQMAMLLCMCVAPRIELMVSHL